MWYKHKWKFENICIRQMKAKGSIDPIKRIFDPRDITIKVTFSQISITYFTD